MKLAMPTMLTLRSKVLFGLAIFSLVFYFFSAAGYVDTIDADPSIKTAQAIYKKGSLRFKLEDPWLSVYSKAPGNSDEYVSKMGLAVPIVYLLPVALASALSKDPETETRVTQFFVSLVNSVFSTVLLCLVFSLLIQRGASVSQAAVVTLLLGTSTVLWPYTKTCQREILQALALVGMVWATQRGKAILTGLFFSIGALTKQAWILPALPIFTWSLYAYRKTSPSRRNLLISSAIGPALYLLHAAYIWESPLGTGYSAETLSPLGTFWSTPFFSGLHSQLISWKTGFFAFNPILLALVPYFYLRFRSKRITALDSACIAAIGLQFCVYSRWLNPLGGANLGPRYAVVVLPLFFLFIDRDLFIFYRQRLPKTLLMALILYSVFLQFIFVSVKAQQVHTLRAYASPELQEAPWLTQTKLFIHKLKGNPEVYNLEDFGGSNQEVDLSPYRSLQGFNFWWAHLYRGHGVSQKLSASTSND